MRAIPHNLLRRYQCPETSARNGSLHLVWGRSWVRLELEQLDLHWVGVRLEVPLEDMHAG
jgi:hypothetical protein